MFKFLSVNNIVIAPASTGNDSNNKNAVINTVHINNGSLLKVIPRHRIFHIVIIKFIAPAIDEIPAKCREKIPKSTALPECAMLLLNGGYKVHPVPTPLSTTLDNKRNTKEGGSSQNEILFILGNDISGAPIIIGTNQLP